VKVLPALSVATCSDAVIAPSVSVLKLAV